VGAFLAVRAAGSVGVTISRPRATTVDREAVPGRWARWRVSRPDEGQQCIDDAFRQPIRAESLWVCATVHYRSFLSYLY
jgi:hypothetical protein